MQKLPIIRRSQIADPVGENNLVNVSQYYECQLFTWPDIVKNNADIELLSLKVCQALLKELSRVLGA